MRQFINGSNRQWRDLQIKSSGCCLKFSNEEMPPGCDPQKADVGFETNADSGKTKLLVENGVSYQGDEEDVANGLARENLFFKVFLS